MKARHLKSLLPDDNLEASQWLAAFRQQRDCHAELLQQALTIVELTGQNIPGFAGESCLQQGLVMADILNAMHSDEHCLTATLLYPAVHYGDLNLEDIEEQFPPSVLALIRGVERMAHMRFPQDRLTNLDGSKAEKIRKMLLAMIDDARVVLIKIAEQIYHLRIAKLLGEATAKEIAFETQTIYTPLANRLGVSELKWELEDLTFRYTQPEAYHQIAQALKEKRHEREAYIQHFVDDLQEKLYRANLKKVKVYGRAKHIFSIYRKMQRKNISFAAVHDIRAVRVIVATLEDCYTALDLVHQHWQALPEEFDDYIAQPKTNGYQSIHTAITTHEEKIVEIQIRTQAMHHQAELGVAAHWAYKEGRSLQNDKFNKALWLRELLAWQTEVAQFDDHRETLDMPSNYERIYVFTPQSDIIDLPPQSTPIDFAYHIHSNVGHRCRGAKVNGHIVPLTTHLNHGDQVEIITGKQPQPNHNWLNKNLGYLNSARAKARVLHWFKQQHQDQHHKLGQALFEKEIKRLNIPMRNINFKQILDRFHLKNKEMFFIQLGSGDLRLGQVLNTIEQSANPQPDLISKKRSIPTQSYAKIDGIGNLLSTLAKCCRPVPGDTILGYITQGRGISIHRVDCANILKMLPERQQRLLSVDWETGSQQYYTVKIHIQAFDRTGLLNDITRVISLDNANVLSCDSSTHAETLEANFYITLKVSSLEHLSQILDHLQQIKHVMQVARIN